MKTTVRVSVLLPDNIATIQRLYDYGTFFSLREELLTEAAEIADFINQLKAQGGKEIHQEDFISDDDMLPHFRVVYEYIT